MNNKLPFVSVVICTYNAEKKIVPTINSLLNQNYPKDKYEIIVVDDYSKDKTVSILKEFPVKLIKHRKNKGLSGARNTGIKHSKGEIYVAFDDDCIADKNWLKEIVRVYQTKKNIGGVAGLIVEKNQSNLTEKFVQEQGCGNPLPQYFRGKNNLFLRFSSYIRSKFYSLDKSNRENIFEIGTMSGANSSFPKDILKKINGWNENLSGTEDTDLISRIRTTDKRFKFYINTKANLIHDHRLTFKRYVLRPWIRRRVIVNQYLQEKKVLPLFPFPVLFLFFSLISIFISWKIFALTIILLPQLLYFWFPIKFIKSFKIKYLIFSYMLLIQEIIALSGIILGYFEVLREHNKKLNKNK